MLEGAQKRAFDLHQRRPTADRLGCEPSHREAEMINIVDLGRVLADIASQTRDPNTAQELMALVHQLFTIAGLPASSPDAAVRH